MWVVSNKRDVYVVINIAVQSMFRETREEALARLLHFASPHSAPQNTINVFVLLWFEFYCGFSAQTAIDQVGGWCG